MTARERLAHQRFVKALQGEPLSCDGADPSTELPSTELGASGASPSASLGATCSGLMEITDTSQLADRVKTFDLRCQACGRTEHLTGHAQPHPPWDDAALLLMADEHLMHQQPSCPNDGTPVVFTSLPNPRRRARYRISCFYCGRQMEVDWPPPESRR